MFFLNFRLSDFPGKLRTDIVLSDRGAEEKFEIARKMKELKLPVGIIMKATGLSAEEIGEL